MTDETIDSYGEIVSSKGWKLERFKANPCVIWAHQTRELPIGRAENIRQNGTALECTIVFASEKANPKAEQCFQLYKERVLNSVSIGFMPGKITTSKRDGQEVTLLEDNDLYELSATCVPANPSALAKMRARAVAEQQAESAAKSAETETIMNETEKKALDDKLAQRDAELRAAEKSIADAKADNALLTKQLADATSAKAALDAQNAVLVTERDASKARAEKAESQLVEKGVDDLVGKKILPAERDVFIELAKSNPSLFEKMVSQRSDLGLLGKSPVGADPNTTNQTTVVSTVDLSADGLED